MSEDDPLDQQGVRRRRAEQKQRQRVSREEEDGDLRWLLERPQGRRFVWRLLEDAGVFRLSYDPQNPIAVATAFAEGNRNYGLRLLQRVLQLDPERYVLMLKESHDRRISPTRKRAEPEPESGTG